MSESRRAEALRLRLSGLTYAAIGEQLKISAARAHQLTTAPLAVRKLVAKRAGYQCQACELPLKLKGHVHHRDINGKSEEDYNDLENLEYLCISCHRRAHNSPRTTQVTAGMTMRMPLALREELIRMSEATGEYMQEIVIRAIRDEMTRWKKDPSTSCGNK